jgi:hypothetical protein
MLLKPGDIMPYPFPPFAALTLHNGNTHNLQLVALGTDGKLYLPAWQCHATGQWTQETENLLAFQGGVFSALALGNGNNGFLQVLALGADRRIYLAAWQDASGHWHPLSTAEQKPATGAE